MNKQTFILISLLTIFICRAAKSQSILYNEQGHLRADTTLTITKEQYEAWSRAEYSLLFLMSKMEYPKILEENNIESNRIYIASFISDTNSLSEIKVLNYPSGLKKDTVAFPEGIIKYFQKYGDSIVNLLKGKSSSKKYLGKYYVPFRFTVFDVWKETKKINSVPVRGNREPLMHIRIE